MNRLKLKTLTAAVLFTTAVGIANAAPVAVVGSGSINLGIDTVNGSTVPTIGASLRMSNPAGFVRVGITAGKGDGYTLSRGDFRAESLPRIGFSPLRVGLMFDGGGVNLSGNGVGSGALYAMAGLAAHWRVAPGATGAAHAAVGESFDASGLVPRFGDAGRAYSVGLGMREHASSNVLISERYTYERIPGGGGVIADHRAVVSVAYAF